MFDNLTQFDTSAANAGAKMELRDASDAPVLKADGSPMTITLLGKDSDAYIKQENAATNRRLAQGTRIKLTAESLKADSVALLARATTAWDFEEPCTYENAVALYTRFPAIKDQVEAFVSERANFTPASPTS
ncbi:MAG: hypothetical protein KAY29_00810 [Brevundimonas sp.]|jgi:hypothetical protein|nr:hypothetical protein [Brevundimonas sp.]